MHLRKTLVLSLIALLILAIAAAAVLTPSLNWRARTFALKASGGLPDISVADIAVMMAPGSPFALQRLPDTRNPYAVIRNPLNSGLDVKLGQSQFMKECSTCHGDHGQGSAVAPSLMKLTLKHGRSDWALYRTIREGVSSTAMVPHDYPRDALWRLVAYVQSLVPSDIQGTDPAGSVAGAAVARVDPGTLAASEVAGQNWSTYSGSVTGSRHSELGQITPDNVAALAPRWVFQLDGVEGKKIECTPLVHEGRMYVTAPSGTVLALDAATGRQLWRFERKPLNKALGWAGTNNRGVALLEDRVYVGTSDAKLIALSANGGKVLWTVDAADPKDNRQITSAPLAIKGLVIVGTTGAYGRGSLAAFDAASGRERWRFYTVPSPGEPGAESWSGDSWKDGGAPPWMTGSYDATRDVVYWGTGNPAPDYNALMRKGDNLYSNSVLALRGQSGKLLWHFQFTPGDDHDWDSAQVPMVAHLNRSGDSAVQLLFANRNGYYYRLDGESGKFVAGKAFAQVTWAKGLDGSGRPIKPPLTEDDARGVLTFPSNVGAINWWPPSLDAKRGLVFLPVIERSQVFFPATPKHDPGVKNFPSDSGQPHYTLIKAVDARSGAEIWQHRFSPRQDNEETAGLLSTASGLVFGGDLNTVVALRAIDGKALWEFNVGGLVSAAPMTYSVGGRQFVAVAAGGAFMAFALPSMH